MRRTVAVIGGGASGMMAAITAAEEGARVILLEKNDRVGKKILSTGNGRCNFTNTAQEPVFYHSDNLTFPWGIVEKFTALDAISFFFRLGVYSKNRAGYMYPNSDQAASVLDALRMELSRLGVEIVTGAQCLGLHPSKKGFVIDTANGTYRADRVILCTGSKAAPATGSDGSGYDLAKSLGHHMVPVLPALVQLRCQGSFFKSLAGVRANAKVSVFAQGECLAWDKGELQLTAYGISGIPVFQVSRFASRALYEKKNVTAVLDFFPDFTQEQTFSFLKSRAQMRPQKTSGQFLIGLFHKKLSELWIRQSGISPDALVAELTEEDLSRLTGLIKGFAVEVTAPNPFEQAQVCCGGVRTDEVNCETLESQLVPGLYFAGELLDVDGCCGGYNLQWAWSSGFVAGRCAAGGSV